MNYIRIISIFILLPQAMSVTCRKESNKTIQDAPNCAKNLSRKEMLIFCNYSHSLKHYILGYIYSFAFSSIEGKISHPNQNRNRNRAIPIRFQAELHGMRMICPISDKMVLFQSNFDQNGPIPIKISVESI